MNGAVDDNGDENGERFNTTVGADGLRRSPGNGHCL